MDAVYELETATAKEIQGQLADPLSYSAVRAVLSRLVDQGHLKYRVDGPRYVYCASQPRQRASRAALRKIVDTFFNGSPLNTMNALLGISAQQMSREELDELAQIVAEAAEKKQ
jgi:predicted transcriptional regulator